MASKKNNSSDKNSLKYQVGKSIRRYLRELDGNKSSDVYPIVLKEVEAPLLFEIMKYCNGNQSEASKMLGLNRGTLRTKLKEYDLLKINKK